MSQYTSVLFYNSLQAILIEMLLTLMLVIVFIHTSMERPELKATSPALCGLTLAAGILAGYVYTHMCVLYCHLATLPYKDIIMIENNDCMYSDTYVCTPVQQQ